MKKILLLAGIILIVLSLSGIAGAMGNVAKKEKLSRYIDNGNGTITDTKTGLMWASKDNGSKINNPPPEGVVLSLPLKGDENASCPQRGRGVVPGFI